MQFSNSILDDFFAPKLSNLLAPSFPEVHAGEDQRLVFALNYKLGGTKFKKAALVSAAVAAMGHHTNAVRNYRAGSEKVEGYIKALPQHSHLSYFAAGIAHFESCIIHTYISALCLQQFQVEVLGEQIFAEKDGSEFDRLRLLNNRIKHYDQDVRDALKRSGAVSTNSIWLTDTSIQCEKGEITYLELAGILNAFTEYNKHLATEFFKENGTIPVLKVV